MGEIEGQPKPWGLFGLNAAERGMLRGKLLLVGVNSEDAFCPPGLSLEVSAAPAVPRWSPQRNAKKSPSSERQALVFRNSTKRAESVFLHREEREAPEKEAHSWNGKA